MPIPWSSIALGADALSSGGQFLSGLKSIFGGGDSNKRASRLAVEAEERAIANQKLMALHLPHYFVEGWKRAGIHPLAAMGAPMASAPSFAVGGGSDNDRFAGLSHMGAGISRAAQAFASKEDQDLMRASTVLSLENQKLQNDRLRSEIALMTTGAPKSVAMNPAIPGQGDSVITVPKEVIAGMSGMEAGQRQALQDFLMPGKFFGGSMRSKSADLGEAMEDSVIGSAVVDLLYTVPDLVRNFGLNMNRMVRNKFARDRRRGAQRYSKFRK